MAAAHRAATHHSVGLYRSAGAAAIVHRRRHRRDQDARRQAPATGADAGGYVYPWRSGPHAHNVFLQVWYELGAVGARLFCALGLAVLAAIARAARPAQAYLAAGFASASVIGAFTWGLWQPWFLAAFVFSAMLAILAAEAQRRSAD